MRVNIIYTVIVCGRNEDPSIGRPYINISKEDILSLRRLNYTWTKISRMLGVSRKTLYRRLEEYEIPHSNYSCVSSDELDEIVKDIKVNFPNDGEVMLQGHMLRLGFKVQRAALRASVHRVDHENTIARRSSTIIRRVYTVPHPNTLWHLDGNHKLIRWRFVIHAGVDGFSRMIVYLKCSDNNRAVTVLASFNVAISSFGTPMCVRTDKGGENVDVWRQMLSFHSNSSCVVTGSSTHNVRVERLWRVRRSVSSNFSAVFTEMETEGVLDTLNDIDTFCLHYVYLPRINSCLKDFQASWNRHSLSTEGNMSPYQLFFEGFSALEGDYEDSSNIGTPSSVPEHISAAQTSVPERVQIPRNSFVPCHNLMVEIQNLQPLSTSSDFGKSLYYEAIQVQWSLRIKDTLGPI